MKLSEKILDLRKNNGLSQEELAERMNVSRQSISRWEVGSASPDAENLKQLSNIFCVSVDYLLNDDAEESVKSDTVKTDDREAKGSLSYNSILFLIASIASGIAAMLFLILAIDQLNITWVIAAVVTSALSGLGVFFYEKSKKQ